MKAVFPSTKQSFSLKRNLVIQLCLWQWVGLLMSPVQDNAITLISIYFTLLRVILIAVESNSVSTRAGSRLLTSNHGYATMNRGDLLIIHTVDSFQCISRELGGCHSSDRHVLQGGYEGRLKGLRIWQVIRMPEHRNVRM